MISSWVRMGCRERNVEQLEIRLDAIKNKIKLKKFSWTYRESKIFLHLTHLLTIFAFHISNCTLYFCFSWMNKETWCCSSGCCGYLMWCAALKHDFLFTVFISLLAWFSAQKNEQHIILFSEIILLSSVTNVQDEKKTITICRLMKINQQRLLNVNPVKTNENSLNRLCN
jgi:hypothetical protein